MQLLQTLSASSALVQEALTSSQKTAQQATTSEQNTSATYKSERVTLSAEALSLSQSSISTTKQSQTSRDQLRAEVQRTIAQVTGLNDITTTKTDKDVSTAADTKLQERAKQANDYFEKNGANPFQGLSRVKLSYIIYGGSGAYTTNERVAALSEQLRQDALNNTYTGSKNKRTTYQVISDSYQQLTALEKAYKNYQKGLKS